MTGPRDRYRYRKGADAGPDVVRRGRHAHAHDHGRRADEDVVRTMRLRSRLIHDSTRLYQERRAASVRPSYRETPDESLRFVIRALRRRCSEQRILQRPDEALEMDVMIALITERSRSQAGEYEGVPPATVSVSTKLRKGGEPHQPAQPGEPSFDGEVLTIPANMQLTFPESNLTGLREPERVNMGGRRQAQAQLVGEYGFIPRNIETLAPREKTSLVVGLSLSGHEDRARAVWNAYRAEVPMDEELLQEFLSRNADQRARQAGAQAR